MDPNTSTPPVQSNSPETSQPPKLQVAEVVAPHEIDPAKAMEDMGGAKPKVPSVPKIPGGFGGGGILKKILIIVVPIILVLAVLSVVMTVIRGTGGGDDDPQATPTQTLAPTPTPVSAPNGGEVITNPSPYANDEDVLRIKDRVAEFDKKILEIDLREEALRMPSLDWEVEFGESN